MKMQIVWVCKYVLSKETIFIMVLIRQYHLEIISLKQFARFAIN